MYSEPDICTEGRGDCILHRLQHQGPSHPLCLSPADCLDRLVAVIGLLVCPWMPQILHRRHEKDRTFQIAGSDLGGWQPVQQIPAVAGEA